MARLTRDDFSGAWHHVMHRACLGMMLGMTAAPAGRGLPLAHESIAAFAVRTEALPVKLSIVMD